MHPVETVSTGIEGLDAILNGGLPAFHIYLIEGNSGAGKTTLALQFLQAGAASGDAVLYVTLSESRSELIASAASHGWSLQGVEIREFIASDASIEREQALTMFHASEVELGETLSKILHEIEQAKARRVVIDALSELRLLSDSPLRYRRQLLALKRFFAEKQCTVLLLDDRADVERDTHVESIVHGVISLEHEMTGYGADRRRIRVRKVRGRQFQAGLHDYVVRTGGIHVYPRLVAAEHYVEFERRALSSGLAPLDALLSGGPQAGTSTLLIGPAGSGKTTIAMQYALAATAQGESASVFMFDELRGLMLDRLRTIGLDLYPAVENGTLTIRQVNPTELSPGEFVAHVRHDVEERGAKVVVIDSLNGYLNSMPHEEFLTAQLHELLAYLGNRGIVTLLVVGQQGIVGSNMVTPIEASYLADSIILFRFFEAAGQVRKAISVTKKRGGGHETTIRELTIDAQGVRLGKALEEFQGVLSGTPLLMTHAI
jgi:circadian clock protein KaiC